MQDLARAAGMSVGNFHRYFPSRAAIGEAIIRVDLDGVEAQIAMIVGAPEPLVMIRAAPHARIRQQPCSSTDATLWAEITAAARREPEIGAVVATMENEITSCLAQAFALTTGVSPDKARARFGAHARLIVLLIEGQPTESLLAEVGDPVEAGQVLERLSKTTPELRRSQLLASVASASATVAQAEAQVVDAEAAADQAARVTYAVSAPRSDHRGNQLVRG